MSICRISGSRYLGFAGLLAILAFSLGTPRALSQADDHAPATGAKNAAPFQLKTTSSLVVVRVVVRNAQGMPVENLTKEDFKLFDRGKEQSIEQFEVETAVAPSASSAAVRGQGTPVLPPAMPGRFIAFYFDDLNTSDSDMIQAREAADHYLTANLQPSDRVAIFTSEEMLSDFTSDPTQIHEALLRLHASVRNVNRTRNCPDLSDYQALQITEFPYNQQSDAWKMALNEAATCEGGVLVAPGGAPSPGSGATDSPTNSSLIVMVIRTSAQTIVSQIDGLTRADLQGLDKAVKYVSQRPGQRSAIMVSPGFISENEQFQVDRLIDHALRSQVVVSSLDPKGLAILMRDFSASQSNASTTNPSLFQAGIRVDSTRELVATGVLADVAYGTGGEFFHNSNDLKAGFGALAGSSVYYILAFTPTDIKLDGTFHALKVILTDKQQGVSIQARRGYFAPKNGNELAPESSEAAEMGPSDPAAQAQEQIREAVTSTTDVTQLPVGLETKLAEGQGETRGLSLSAHLDGSSLHFHKDGEHNLNTVTFIFAVFDQKGNLLNAQMRRAKVNILDAQVPSFSQNGVDMQLTFQLKPGTYRIREVVADSEDHHMTSLSRNVTIP
jgi:VWFA-related protein